MRRHGCVGRRNDVLGLLADVPRGRVRGLLSGGNPVLGQQQLADLRRERRVDDLRVSVHLLEWRLLRSVRSFDHAMLGF
jgi:hypothetical protein